MKLKHVVMAMGVALGLTACGGGGGGSSSVSPVSYDFNVTAIDGYLKNAVVTATCDGKSFTGTITNEGGVSGVKTNGYDSTACSVAITAKADGSTTDVDTGKKFAAGSLYLVSPAGQAKTGNLIASPFTTLVALLMQSSGGSIDLAAAIDEIASQFGIDESVVMGDFIAKKDVKAALKSYALLSSPLWPKSATAFNLMAANKAVSDALFAQLELINTAVEARIAELENDGVDLSTIVITITVNSNGTISTAVVKKTVNNATGATGSSGSSGGTGN